jgi:hypothetical protein
MASAWVRRRPSCDVSPHTRVGFTPPQNRSVVLSPENFCERGLPLRLGPDELSPFTLDVVFASDRSPNMHLLGDEFAQLFGPAKTESDLLCLGDLLEDPLLTKT